MIKPVIKASTGIPINQEEVEQLKFNLYLKNRQVLEISKIMDQVQGWPEKNRKKWAKKFSPDISNMLDDFLDETVSSFDGISLDQELMGLFAEFTQNLKSVTKQVQGVVSFDDPMDA